MTPRRSFLQHLVAVGAATPALAGAQAHVAASDPQAIALGYVEDTTKADQKKYPGHTATQHCGVCALGKFSAGQAWGECPLFAGRQVSEKGWCSAWSKKP